MFTYSRLKNSLRSPTNRYDVFNVTAIPPCQIIAGAGIE
jgi:hypothetical protein